MRPCDFHHYSQRNPSANKATRWQRHAAMANRTDKNTPCICFNLPSKFCSAETKEWENGLKNRNGQGVVLRVRMGAPIKSENWSKLIFYLPLYPSIAKWIKTNTQQTNTLNMNAKLQPGALHSSIDPKTPAVQTMPAPSRNISAIQLDPLPDGVGATRIVWFAVCHQVLRVLLNTSISTSRHISNFYNPSRHQVQINEHYFLNDSSECCSLMSDIAPYGLCKWTRTVVLPSNYRAGVKTESAECICHSRTAIAPGALSSHNWAEKLEITLYLSKTDC